MYRNINKMHHNSRMAYPIHTHIFFLSSLPLIHHSRRDEFSKTRIPWSRSERFFHCWITLNIKNIPELEKLLCYHNQESCTCIINGGNKPNEWRNINLSFQSFFYLMKDYYNDNNDYNQTPCGEFLLFCFLWSISSCSFADMKWNFRSGSTSIATYSKLKVPINSINFLS